MSKQDDTPRFKTREEWLEEAVRLLADRFPEPPDPLPRVSMGCGYTRGNAAIGWCYERSCARDGRSQIFISPKLQDPLDPTRGVLPTLLHEMVHAVLPDKEGHGRPFKKLAEEVGLSGPATTTYAEEALVAELQPIADVLGPFPHSALDVADEATPQKNRHGKVSCATCGYIARVSKKWLSLGAPLCPCNREPMQEEEVEEDEDLSNG